MWKLHYSKQADKDALKLKAANLKEIAHKLLKVIATNPFHNQPPYEKLSGELNGAYSRRINVKHRLIYEVDKDSKSIYILRMWTHYE